jgi:hypothetical protein
LNAIHTPSHYTFRHIHPSIHYYTHHFIPPLDVSPFVFILDLLFGSPIYVTSPALIRGDKGEVVPCEHKSSVVSHRNVPKPCRDLAETHDDVFEMVHGNIQMLNIVRVQQVSSETRGFVPPIVCDA